MTGIYKITSPTNRIYIGQSIDIESRFKIYERKNAKGQPRLFSSFKKYGVDNHKFSVLLECDIEQLNELERYYQEIYNVTSKAGLNCMLTKSNNMSGGHSEETKLKMSEAQKGLKPNLGKKFSEETKEKMRESAKARIRKPHSEETKLKMRKTRSDEIREKMREAWKERGPMSDETKRKIGLAGKGKKRSDETIRKMCEARKLYHANKKLQNITL